MRGQRKQWKRDALVFSTNRALADGTVFQSSWSWTRTDELRYRYVHPATQILNAPNSGIFHPKSGRRGAKLGILISSWSSNPKKGFSTYEFLDTVLDSTRFRATFVGRSPLQFKNILNRGPLLPADLADEARRNSIFLTASEDDPCSNALIEAIHCGLVPVALNSGGNTEIVSDSGLLFTDHSELMAALEYAAELSRERSYRHNLPNLPEVGQQYLAFFDQVLRRPARPSSWLSKVELHAIATLNGAFGS